MPSSTAVPKGDGTLEDEDTEVLRRAKGGTPNPPSLTGRPLVLRPENPSYPQVWVIAKGVGLEYHTLQVSQAVSRALVQLRFLDRQNITPTRTIFQTKFGVTLH